MEIGEPSGCPSWVEAGFHYGLVAQTNGHFRSILLEESPWGYLGRIRRHCLLSTSECHPAPCPTKPSLRPPLRAFIINCSLWAHHSLSTAAPAWGPGLGVLGAWWQGCPTGCQQDGARGGHKPRGLTGAGSTHPAHVEHKFCPPAWPQSPLPPIVGRINPSLPAGVFVSLHPSKEVSLRYFFFSGLLSVSPKRVTI